MSDRKTGKESKKIGGNAVEERQHPLKTYLFFALVGSSILFLSLVLMYVIWLDHNLNSIVFQMPKAFIMSTIIILLSSYSLTYSIKSFHEDNTKSLLLSLSLTLFLGVSFTALQIIGWTKVYESGNFIDGNVGFAFLFIITGLHFLHVVGGLFYLLFLSLKAFDNWNDPIKALVYFSNNFEKTRIELFSTYWHFIGAIWIFLFFIFLFTL